MCMGNLEIQATCKKERKEGSKPTINAEPTRGLDAAHPVAGLTAVLATVSGLHVVNGQWGHAVHVGHTVFVGLVEFFSVLEPVWTMIWYEEFCSFVVIV